MSDPVPPNIGASGLIGRPSVRPPNIDLEQPVGYDEQGAPIFEQPPAEGPSIPGSCLRVLHTPLPVGQGGDCPFDCPGRQADNSCLLDIVRAAQAQDVEWSFEVKMMEWGPLWIYNGPPLA